MSKVKRELYRGDALCDHCSDKAVVRFSARLNSRIYRGYACSKGRHQRLAKSSLEESW